MPRWKRLAILCLVLFVLAAAGCSGRKTDTESVLENGKLRVLMNPEFPPYEYKDADGNIVGADVEIAKRIAAMLGWNWKLWNAIMQNYRRHCSADREI